MNAARVILGPTVFEAMKDAISPIGVLELAVRTAFYGDLPEDGESSLGEWIAAREVLREGMRRLHKEGKLD